jgi:hypothetical protein
VLVTGATGYIATLVLPALRERYALTLVDVTNEDRDGHLVDDVQILDLLDDPDDRLVTICADIDTIVHFGFRRPSEPATYLGERVNVDMTARILEVAAATDVQRVVCTSTNQASKWYERPYKQRLIDRVDPYDYPRPTRLHQRSRPTAALRPLHRGRIHRRRLRCSVSDLLRCQQQRTIILEHQQRPAGHRLPAAG